ncbi:SPOR domain-containing protein (plasmid) [Photobacterium sp. GJ3]|uniref:SPOR domain-containing protein n=1 Tax=Photobacterium sp. GJ3 TaxID=2829502 RepID=UPI001B8CE447|nr:SPOR domain-containing protein [Photobacterium sp. GJ3]QUJ70379.1 SPOR domain-containing protein [Photobacterium sp. GJ3]
MKKLALMVAITSALAGCALDNERQTINGAVVPSLEDQEQAALAQQQIEPEPMSVEYAEEPIEPLRSGDIAVTDEVVPPEQEIAPVDTPAMAQEKQVEVQQKAMPEMAPAAPQKPTYEYASEPVTGFTVQVLGLSKNNGFAPYVAKLPGEQPVWVNQKTYQEKPWYTLLYGHFDTVQEAQAAIKALPSDIQSFGPFVRSMAKIHQSAEPKLTKVH